MTNTLQLSDKWIKASILGTVWASSEIVLGSFLHNLRVPFSGNILTAIGVVILISASYKWQERGLFWRAGIICALLKTMSPSAVIFGPMVAIVSEAFLLEFSVRMLGQTIPGYLLGSVLAMSWNLIQKIFNFIIFYGYNIVEVYTNLMKYAQRQLNLQFDVVWSPFLLLLIIYALFGAFSALVGVKTGRRLLQQPELSQKNIQNKEIEKERKREREAFNYSIPWLLLNITLMTGSLVLVDRIPTGYWVAFVAAIVLAWALRYKRALRQLVRPRLWIFFVLITMLAAFVFTRLQKEPATITDAFLIGVKMNLRAIVLIMGFTVLGTELYHPKIRHFLGKSYFKQLPPALELSLESLPSMIAGIPDLKSIIKNPVVVVNQLMAHAESRLKEIQNVQKTLRIFILTGKVGIGKTSCVEKLIEDLNHSGISVGGIYSARVLNNNKVEGYDVVNISTKERTNFLRLTKQNSTEKIGRFFICQEGLTMGNEILQSSPSQITIIDEAGKLELADGGWSQSIKYLTRNPGNNLLLTVREETIDDILRKYKLQPAIIFNLSERKCSELVDTILSSIKS